MLLKTHGGQELDAPFRFVQTGSGIPLQRCNPAEGLPSRAHSSRCGQRAGLTGLTRCSRPYGAETGIG
jgi:hypothetical protein